jgi:hypothetical protein
VVVNYSFGKDGADGVVADIKATGSRATLSPSWMRPEPKANVHFVGKSFAGTFAGIGEMACVKLPLNVPDQ